MRFQIQKCLTGENVQSWTHQNTPVLNSATWHLIVQDWQSPFLTCSIPQWGARDFLRPFSITRFTIGVAVLFRKEWNPMSISICDKKKSPQGNYKKTKRAWETGMAHSANNLTEVRLALVAFKGDWEWFTHQWKFGFSYPSFFFHVFSLHSILYVVINLCLCDSLLISLESPLSLGEFLFSSLFLQCFLLLSMILLSSYLLALNCSFQVSLKKGLPETVILSRI